MTHSSRRYRPLILGVLGFFLTACPSGGGPDGAPVIGSFSANPAAITAGQSATLTWSVSGSPTGLTIDNGVGPVSGTSRAVTPSVTTRYTLTATNSSGQNATASTTVTVSGGVTPPPPGTVPDFGVSASQTGPFQNDADGNILSAADARVVNVDPGDTFYARVSYSDPEGVSNIVVRLANRSPAGFAADLVPDQNVGGFTLGAPLPGCDLAANPTSVTCIYPVTVAPGTPNISSLTGAGTEFAYVLRTRVTDAAGTIVDEPPRGYVTVGSVGGGTTGGTTGSTTGGTTGTTTGSTTGSTTGGTTGGTTGSTTGTTTGGTTGTTGGTTGSTTGGADTVRPSVTIDQAATQADPTSSSTVNYTVRFSENVTGFNRNDVELGGAGATNTTRNNLAVFGSGAAYRVQVSGLTTPGPVVAAVSTNAAADAAGNRNTRSTSTDNSVEYAP